jgi:hypothetical protein
MNVRNVFGVSFTAVIVAIGAIVLAQTPITPQPTGSIPKPTIGSDKILFTSNVGSFKILGSDLVPAKGVLDVKVDGTILVSGLEGNVQVEGLTKEYELTDYKKIAYHGKGRLVLNGTCRSVQAFGRAMSCSFKGNGLLRLYGEFDRNLETGWVQYEGGDREAWGTGGNVKVIPQQIYSGTPNVKVKDSE